jgi:hypothetical protein
VVEVGGDADRPPIAIPHSGTRKSVVFYVSKNGRDQPGGLDESPIIEGTTEGEAA